MVNQNADLKMESLTKAAPDAVFASPCEPLILVGCFTPLPAPGRPGSLTELSLDHIFQCGMGWPFGCTDLHGVSKGERRRRLVRQGEPGRGCACKRVAKSRHIESERIEDLLRCDPARGN